ncbi:MAG: hypothetical protein WC517_03145 [Patescibacteria group bacterium]
MFGIIIGIILLFIGAVLVGIAFSDGNDSTFFPCIFWGIILTIFSGTIIILSHVIAPNGYATRATVLKDNSAVEIVWAGPTTVGEGGDYDVVIEDDNRFKLIRVNNETNNIPPQVGLNLVEVMYNGDYKFTPITLPAPTPPTAEGE